MTPDHRLNSTGHRRTARRRWLRHFAADLALAVGLGLGLATVARLVGEWLAHGSEPLWR